MSEAGRTVVSDPQIESFTPAAVSRGITSSTMTEHLAVGGITASPSFLVQASSGMISLSESYFAIDLAISRNDGAGNLTNPSPGFPNGDFHPNQLLPDLLWSECETYLNSTKISDDFSNVYPWAAFTRYMLTESPESGGTHAMLPLVGGVANTRMPLYPYSIDANLPGNAVADPIPGSSLQRGVIDFEAEGYARYWVSAGKIARENTLGRGAGPATTGQQVALYLKMFHGGGGPSDGSRLSIVWRPNDSVWNMKGYIPASSELRVDLQHAAGALAFKSRAGVTAFGQPNFAASTMSLWIKRYQLSEDAREALSAKMRVSPLLYPITRSRVAQVNIAGGVTAVNTSGLLMGQRPSMVAVMFLRSSLLRAATTADREITPFCLSGAASYQLSGPPLVTDIVNVAVRDIQITWGDQLIPSRRYEAENGDRSRASTRAYAEYAALCGGKPAISYESFCFNYSVYMFDCTRDSTGSDGFAPGVEEGSGSLTVNATLFDDSIETPHTMIVVGMGASTVVLYASGEVRRVGY